MKCKFCDTDGLAWPENWKKGMKPIEADTGKIHDLVRCKSFQNSNQNPRHGWLKIECEECHVVTNYNKKRYTERTIPRPCRDCYIKKFNNLDEYGISL